MTVSDFGDSQSSGTKPIPWMNQRWGPSTSPMLETTKVLSCSIARGVTHAPTTPHIAPYSLRWWVFMTNIMNFERLEIGDTDTHFIVMFIWLVVEIICELWTRNQFTKVILVVYKYIILLILYPLRLKSSSQHNEFHVTALHALFYCDSLNLVSTRLDSASLLILHSQALWFEVVTSSNVSRSSSGYFDGASGAQRVFDESQPLF